MLRDNRLLEGVDLQPLRALLAFVDSLWLREGAVELVGAEFTLRQASDVVAGRAAAINGTDASAVSVHKAFVELSLDNRLELGVLSRGYPIDRLVLDDSGKAGHDPLDVVEVTLLL